MSITIVYNNISNNNHLKSGWGFAAWIEINNNVILFDTGADGDILLHNLSVLELDVKRISAIFLSHNHWDHSGGLKVLSKTMNPGTRIFVPKKSLIPIRNENPYFLIEPVEASKEIFPFMWSTGQIKTTYKETVLYEQSLVLVKDSNIYLITGCSHPGIERVVDQVNTIFPDKIIQIIIGGFHLLDQTIEKINLISEHLRYKGVRYIAPSHCTGDIAINQFKRTWGNKFINMNLGEKYNL